MTSDSRTRRLALAATFAAALLAACGGGSTPSNSGPSEGPSQVISGALSRQIDALRVPGEVDTSAVIAPSLRAAKGSVEVWVAFADAPLAAKRNELRPQTPGVSWKESDDSLKASMKAHRDLLIGKQNSAASSLASMGATELGRVRVSHNAIAVRVDASQLKQIAEMPGVVAVRPVRHYELALAETVPYVGGKAVQDGGVTGVGVKVAVLDSGIDYTHRNMGGAGTAAAYEAAWGTSPDDPKNTTRDGLFPTPKVVDGYDFVGETWTTTSGTRTEDPDPIDFEGHGTHVADIIAGIGPNKGMAPGAKLVAVKVCSAVSSSCNGIALIKGMDFALDPNGDGDLSDTVDVINLSLGSSYGQDEDDLSQAAANAVTLGVSVVVSAGNSANRPYIVGSPSSALGVLSVAQTAVPSAVVLPLVINSPASIAGVVSNTNTVDWAPVGSGFAGEVKLASTASGTPSNLACTALPAGSMAGVVALIDRGTCSISVKVHNAATAGAVGVLIANNAAGDPPTFSFGGPDPFTPAPTLVLTQSDGARIKANAAAPVNVTVSSANSIALAGSMASTSSRGPGFSNSTLKPEIGAPGASVSAEATTGDGETAFGGTSGASPMVAGAAALLRSAHPNRSSEQIKAMLMNSANTTVYNNPATQPGVLAPISRIGAGELRVNRALSLNAVAYNRKGKTAAVAFGFAEVDKAAELNGELQIDNFTNSARTYTVTSSYRYANDAASGATQLELPGSVVVAPGGSVKFDVKLRVDGSKLPAWQLNGGSSGGNGALLEGNEVDGYITLTAGAEIITVPFHALLRKSSAIDVIGTEAKVGKDFELSNKGVNGGAFDLFALTGTSDKFAKKLQSEPGDNFVLIDLRAVGVRAFVNDDIVQFAVSRWDRRAHPAYPAAIEIYIDSDNDGVDDFVVFNQENGTFASTGQTLVRIFNFNTGTNKAFYFLDADLQSANGIFTVPMSEVGLTAGSKFRFSVYAYDNYFTGEYTDAIESMTYTLGSPRYVASGGVLEGGLAPSEKLKLRVHAVAGGDVASPSQSGFLLLYRQNKDEETDIVTVKR